MKTFIRGVTFGSLGVMAFGLGTAFAAGPENRTISLMVGRMEFAGYYDPTGADCPKGYNPMMAQVAKKEMLKQGYTQEKIDEIYALEEDDRNRTVNEVMRMRGMKDGKASNAYAHPETAEDPVLLTVEGPHGYGLNLDGKVKAGDFTNPDTGEKGIDNNYYKTIGCSNAFKQQKDGTSGYPESQIFTSMEEKPAHLIEITEVDSLENDDEVKVGYYTSLDPLSRDAVGRATQDRTMRVDPNPKWRNVTTGKIKNGILETEAFGLKAEGDPHGGLWSYDLKKAKLRLNLKAKPDGTMMATLGGYHDIYPLYWMYANTGSTSENFTLNLVGYYNALKRLADFDPDPKTGKNRAISIGYTLFTVPAVIVHPQKQTASAQ